MEETHINYLGESLLLKSSFFTNEEPNDLLLKFIHQWGSGTRSFITNTSGSTGVPKPITLERNQIIASINQTQKALNLERGDTCLINLSPDHIAGKMMVARAMEIGMQMTIVPASKNPLVNIDSAFDFYSFVPLQIQTIIEENPNQIPLLNKAKAIIIGGAKVSVYLQSLIENKISTPVYATFGMTETVSHIALKRLNPLASYYSVLNGVEIATDERKCLRIKGEVTNNKWIQTNDIVNLLSRGFNWVGRIDNVINSGGVKLQVEKIELGIERTFHQLKMDNRFIVFGEKNQLFGETVSLIIEAGNIDQKSILKEFSTYLTKYEIPKNIYTLKSFPETDSKKIDRNKTIRSIS